MSEFHGGFFVEKVDGKVLEPIRRAVRDYLFRETKLGPKYELAFAARRGAPVLHVAVRNEDADGKGYAFFHQNHYLLGAEIARAAGATVHAYYYENQVGSEGVSSFDPSGAEIGSANETWDDFADREGFDPDDDDDLFAALPLGQLAEKLEVERSLLDMVLAYDTPVLRVKLVGDVPQVALTEYLRRAPRAPGNAPPGWPAMTLYFPEPWLSEIDALATRLDVPESVLIYEAFEIAKPQLYQQPPVEGSAGALPPPPLAIPGRAVPSVLDLSDRGAALADLASGDKASVKVALPPDVWPQLKELAAHLDRSLSWVLQRAWRLSREQLHGAKPKVS